MRRFALGAALVLGLAACGGNNGGTDPGGGGGNTLAGAVSVPQGSDVKGTVVAICFVTGGKCDLNSPNTKIGQISASGTQASFSVSGLAAGSYGILAQKDVNGNGKLDDGDLYGCYGDAKGCLAVRPPKSGLTVQMQVYSSGGGGGSGTGSLSGTLIFPGSLPSPTGTNSLGFASGGAGQEYTGVNATPKPVRTSPGERWVPGEVIVSFRQGVSLQSVNTLAVGGVQLARVRLLTQTGLTLYRSPSGGDSAALAQALKSRGDVADAFPNWILSMSKTPNDTYYPLQWHYPLINLPAAWDITDGSANAVTVAVVDTGITAHPDLQGKTVPGYDFVDGDANPSDPGTSNETHGTHVAGTIAAATNNSRGVAGVSWGAKILPVRVLDGNGSGSFDKILAGIAWAAGQSVQGVPSNPNPAKVINLSLGGDSAQGCPSSVNQFFQGLAQKGVIAVVAAGNENEDTAKKLPASCDGTITVGAVGPTGKRAPYSNFGAAVKVMAPGGDPNQSFTYNGQTYPAGVLSTQMKPDGTFIYGFLSGTSMATPHVAGVVALMLSKTPSLSFQQILSNLQNSATPLSAANCDRPSASDCGAGLIDAVKAVNGLGGGNPGPGPTPPPGTGAVKTYIVAFYCSNTTDCFPYDQDKSAVFTVQATSSRFPFSLTNLQAGPYVVAAWTDTNGNQQVDDGEPFGVYQVGSKIQIVTLQAGQNLGGLIIDMQPAQVSSNSLGDLGPSAQAGKLLRSQLWQPEFR